MNILSKEFSWKLFNKAIVLVFIGALITGVLLYLSSDVFIGGSYIQSLKRLAFVRTDIMKKSLIIYFFTGLLIIAGLGFLTLFYSHRIAGPLFRLGKEAKRIAQGDLTVHVRLRSKDAIHPIADTLNEVVEVYKVRVIDLRDRLKAVREAARALEDIPAEAPDLNEKIDRLSMEVRSLQEKLKELRL